MSYQDASGSKYLTAEEAHNWSDTEKNALSTKGVYPELPKKLTQYDKLFPRGVPMEVRIAKLHQKDARYIHALEEELTALKYSPSGKNYFRRIELESEIERIRASDKRDMDVEVESDRVILKLKAQLQKEKKLTAAIRKAAQGL